VVFWVCIAGFAVGVGGTGWLLRGEVFPTPVRGRAGGIGAAADWLANYGLVIMFPSAAAGLGLGWVMVIFAGLCAVGVVFVYRFLPETKGKSVEEVVELFNGPVNLKHPSQPTVPMR